MFLPNGGKGGGGTENREGYPQLRGGSSSENGRHAGGIVTPVGLLLVDDDEDVRRYENREGYPRLRGGPPQRTVAMREAELRR